MCGRPDGWTPEKTRWRTAVEVVRSVGTLEETGDVTAGRVYQRARTNRLPVPLTRAARGRGEPASTSGNRTSGPDVDRRRVDVAGHEVTRCGLAVVATPVVGGGAAAR